MTDLQKVVVLCLVLIMGVFIGTQWQTFEFTKEADTDSDLPTAPTIIDSTDTTIKEVPEPAKPTPVPDIEPEPAVTSFAECVDAGFPVMESYPRQCTDGSQTFVEEIDEPIACTADAKICPDGSAVGREGPNCEFAACPAVIGTACTPAQKAAEACTLQYDPVCGYASGTDTDPQTYGNACGACATDEVISYTPGECQTNQLQLQI